jgi:hypothetical protein
MKINFPAQNIKIDTPTGLDPLWYQQLQSLATFVNMFSEINPATLTDGQVLIWNAAQQKFLPGPN